MSGTVLSETVLSGTVLGHRDRKVLPEVKLVIGVYVFAWQGLEEGHDCILVRIRGFSSQLELEHGINRVAQGRCASVVQIWGGMCGHAQAGDLEGMPVGLVAGDIEASQVGVGDVAPFCEIIVNHAEYLKHIAAHVCPLVA